jgi:hypothetical protein
MLLFAGRLKKTKTPGSKSSDTEPPRGILKRITPARGWITRIMKWMTERQFGQPLENLSIVGHHGWALFGASMYEMAVDNFNALNPRLQSLVQLRVAQIVGCPW